MIGGSVTRTARRVARVLSDAAVTAGMEGACCACAADGAAADSIAAARKNALVGKGRRARPLKIFDYTTLGSRAAAVTAAHRPTEWNNYFKRVMVVPLLSVSGSWLLDCV
jgi:hypothetical protein